ncbi:CoA-transferase family III [Gloeophyllum trabeum ATCC 11539]|uniref:CoA-transferase family III n=1 Tax=Gloeophyllum trabeum (strain ATCC 11539 / FP-39264 / Madison 617) TaxID=670483 RepID=S7Q424_GLOTA|nr:CoA-transferase family III [Gloeophyllum trabeum ATCC 11539]EPQ54771.1 CoA-transferase family III [Gloeophyllum trabeum ATCC 11539]
MTFLESTKAEPAKQLWDAVGLPPEELSHLRLSPNADPAVDSSFRLGTAAQAKSENWYTINGSLAGSGSLWDDIAGLYRTKGGYVRIHTNFPHHRQGILDILQCEPNKDSVAEALSSWDSIEFETVASARGMCATALRSFEEWDEHPQAKALRGVPPVSLSKIGDAPRREIERDVTRPLDGIRVLDFTRVLAGPVCGRTLAAHGADVLWITSPKLPSLPLIDVDTSRGKRTAQLDLTSDADAEILRSLVREADVFLQAYRPGGLEAKGFGVAEVTRERPGIFDSLVQTATGFNVAEGEAYAAHSQSQKGAPRPLPLQALDHTAGYFLCLGINAALARTVTEGGSWEVRVSLAAVGQWIRSLGRLPPQVGFGEGLPLPARQIPLAPEIAALSTTVQGCGEVEEKPRRTMTAIRHAAILSYTPVREGEAPMGLNKHATRWLPRKFAQDSIRFARTVL